MKTKELHDKLKYEASLIEAKTPFALLTLEKDASNIIWQIFDERKKCATFSPIGQWLSVTNDCPKSIALLLVEYVKTPLEEREEEKKYRLRLPNGFESMLGEDYVCLTSDKVRERYVITAKETYHGFRNIFTQKEIDKMPQTWQEFFIKEEVK